MIGGMIVTHATFAEGLKAALEMITGKQDCLCAVGLKEGEGLEKLIADIEKQKSTMKDCEAIYLFVDLFGATPCNASSILCAQGGCEVIAGVNLPLLLTFVMKRVNSAPQELRKALEQTSLEDFRWITQKDILKQD